MLNSEQKESQLELDDLRVLITEAPWFSRCGEFAGEPNAVALSAMSISEKWSWLPTSRDQRDPIHSEALIVEARAVCLDERRRSAEMDLARRVLASLRVIPDQFPALVDGTENFTLAAKGGAQFAARMAAREVVVGHPGFWCRAVQIFAAGYWPCGIVCADQRLVVF